ncbi:hypothetical protein [Oleidesulfovibrio sp.]|uniref:hypothetical protein n=1 Tax=Oleidesulfovibrio sp. TaxID=2909707 RepID=UPI003A8A3E4F
MIPCHVCGQDASTHWILGLTPSCDSFKTGLCTIHDNEENRAAASKAWQKFMYSEVSKTIRLQASGHKPQYTLTVRYADGGSESMPCLFYSIFENMALQVTPPEGPTRFYLLRYIKSYEVSM